MLNYLFSYLSSEYSFLNVFRYITFRTGVSIFTSLTIVLLLGGPFINYLKSSKHFDQPIRNDGPISHIINKYIKFFIYPYMNYKCIVTILN